VHLPMSGIIRLETRRVNIARTAVVTVLGVVGATAFFTLATCANRSCIP
jgi:hypothetical protein